MALKRISSTVKDDGTRRIVVQHDTLKLFAKAHAVPLTVAFDRIAFRITVALCTSKGEALPHDGDDKGIAKDEPFEFYASADDDTPLADRPAKLKADFDAAIDARALRLFAAAANRNALASL